MNTLTAILSPVFTFVFVFSLLYIIKVVYTIVRAVMTEGEEKADIGEYTALFAGLALSYIVTFIVTLL